jgi:hypothetical protein
MAGAQQIQQRRNANLNVIVLSYIRAEEAFNDLISQLPPCLKGSNIWSATSFASMAKRSMSFRSSCKDTDMCEDN